MPFNQGRQVYNKPDGGHMMNDDRRARSHSSGGNRNDGGEHSPGNFKYDNSNHSIHENKNMGQMGGI
jgi:hypothetical protein